MQAQDKPEGMRTSPTRWMVSALGVLAIGCGGGAAQASPHPGSPTVTASATAAASPSSAPPVAAALPLGVVVKDFLTGDGGPTYSISLVDVDGRVVATATGAKRSVFVQMPNISASNTHIYYLDGDSRVMALGLDGTTAAATTVPVVANSAAIFSVSPDDTRIAVALNTIPYPARTRIYVEDLQGGGHHVELFSSTSVLEWPVGWHEGHIVIAVGRNAQPQNAYEGFERAEAGYHVADAATGTRIAAVCTGYQGSGPPVAAGSVCTNFPAHEVSDWSGVTRPLQGDSGCGGGVLAPDGLLVADCQGNPRTVTLVAKDGTTISTAFRATPYGWIDATHVVVQSDTDSSLGILDTTSLRMTQVQARGFFGAAIPGSL